MERIKRLLVALWRFLFDDRGHAVTIKWCALVVALLFDGCGGLVAADSFPILALLGFALLNGFIAFIAGVVYDRFAWKEGGERFKYWVNTRWWKPFWFFSAMALVIFVSLFRLGCYQNEIYYDRDAGVAIEPAAINFLPYQRYQILETPDKPFDPGFYLSRKMKVGTAQVNVTVSMPMTVYKEDIFQYMVEKFEGTGHLDTGDIINFVAAKLPNVLLSKPEEAASTDFARKYEAMVKAFFLTQGITVKGTLEVRNIEIYPNYYNEAGEMIYQ